MQIHDAFTEIAIILLLAALIGAAGTWLRQPLIVSFIALGLIVGPSGIGLVTRHGEIALLASVGISLLLFVVGLKLDLNVVRTTGRVALATGVGQILFTSAIGYLIAIALGMEPLPALYVAVALTFSSTIIIVKLLSDKREIDTLHGRIAVGFLIVQDIAAILAMIGLTAVASGTGESSLLVEGSLVVLKAFAFLALVVVAGIWLLPRATQYLARIPELLVLSGIAWALALAALSEWIGLSKEVGAFLAGTSLASTRYRDALGGRLQTLRDFLLLFFFVDLGTRLDLSLLGGTLGWALLFSLFVLVGNPLIVMAIMGAMGYRKRTGFMAGLTVAQISEFSLILTALGLDAGFIDRETMGLVTTVGLVTIGLSTYMILYSGPLYERLAPWLGVFERRSPYRELRVEASPEVPCDVIVFGLGRYGGAIVRHLLTRKRRVVGVDFDPRVLDAWRARGVPVHYGDANDPELLDRLPLERAKWVVSTAPDPQSHDVLVHHLRERGFQGKIAVACRDAQEALVERIEGVDVLLRPYTDGAELAVDSITSALDRIGRLGSLGPALREVRLTPGSVWSGRCLLDVPLGTERGVSVLAVSRSGRSVFHPEPTFQLFPGDRLVLVGDRHALEATAQHLTHTDFESPEPEQEDFVVDELPVSALGSWAGRSLAQLEPRERLGVVVLAVARADGSVASPDLERILEADDRLVLAGARQAVEQLVTGPAADAAERDESP